MLSTSTDRHHCRYHGDMNSVTETYRPLGIKVMVISLTGSNRRPVMSNDDSETPADEFMER